MSSSDDKAGLFGLVRAFMDWLNTPWKAVTAFIMGASALLFLIVYENRVALVQILIEKEERYQIAEDKAPLVVAELLRVVDGQVGVLFKFEVARNKRTALFSVNRAGRAPTVEPRTLPIVRSIRYPAIVLPGLLTGEVPCSSIRDNSPPDIQGLADKEGIVTFCMSGINTPFGDLEGAIMVAFDKRPADLDPVITAMRTAASELIRLGRR